MQDEEKRFRIITLTLVGAFVALWLFFVPTWGDEIIYQNQPPKDTANIEDEFWDQAGARVESFGDALRGAQFHYTYINGRLINLFPFFLNLLPSWVWPLLNGFMAGGMLWLIWFAAYRLNKRPIPSWLFALSALLLWKWLPWYDTMSCQVYFINYVWTCAAAIAFILLYLGDARRRNRASQLLGVLLAFFVGTAHEEFALCAIAGVLSWHVATRRLPRGYQYVWLCVLLAATAIGVFSASTLGRLGRIQFTGLSLYINYMLMMSPTVTAICFVSAPRKTWHFFCRKESIAWLAFALTGLLISLIWNIEGRVLWPFAAGMLILDMALVGQLFSRRVTPEAGRTATWIILGILVLWSVGVLIVQYRVGRLQQNVLDQMEMHPGEYVLSEKAPRRSMAPFWTFGMVNTWACDYRAWEIQSVAHSQMEPGHVALPEEWCQPLRATEPGLYGTRDMVLSDHLFEGVRAVEAEDSEGVFDMKISCPRRPVVIINAKGDTLYCLGVDPLWLYLRGR